MPLGPVFRHEMVAAGRKRRYIVLRVVVGLLLLAMLAMCYATALTFSSYGSGIVSTNDGLSIAGVSQLTASFYVTFAWSTLLGVLFITPAIAAGAIATERERRTIEYLFATDLSNSEIVLDKLVARLLTVGQIVLAAFPLLAIFRLLGGVPGGLVLIHFAILASSATLVASISIAVSTWCERARDAVPRAYGRVFLLLIAPALVQGFHLLIVYFTPPSKGILILVSVWFTYWIIGPLEQALLTINPIYMLGTAGGVSSSALGVDLDLSAIGLMIVGQLLFSAACLALSISSVRKVHLNATTQSLPTKKAIHSHRKQLPLACTNPVLWRESRSNITSTKVGPLRRNIGNGIGVLALFLMIGVNLWTAITSGRSDAWEDYFQFAAMMVGCLSPILLLLLGCRAAGLITYEKERETWLSLLATPLSAKEIIHGKLWGNLWAYRWPLAAIVVIPAAGLIVRGDTILATLGVVLAIIVVAWAATAIGLLLSLWCKSSLKAIGMTIAVLVGMGGAYLPFAFIFAAAMGIRSDSGTIFLMSSCVPFLCIAPIAVYGIEIGDDVPFLAAYVIGIIGYVFLALLTTAMATKRFDQLCERSNGGWQNNAKKGEPSALATSAKPKSM